MAKAIVRMVLLLHFMTCVLSIQHGHRQEVVLIKRESAIDNSPQSQLMSLLMKDQTIGKRSAELVDGDWFQDRPPAFLAKRRPKISDEPFKRSKASLPRDFSLEIGPSKSPSYWNMIPTLDTSRHVTERVINIGFKETRLQKPTSTRPPKSPSYWNMIPTLDTSRHVTERVINNGFKETGLQKPRSTHKIKPFVIPGDNDAGRELDLTSSNEIPEESDDNRSDVIPLPLPGYDDGKGPDALHAEVDMFRKSTTLAALLRTIWYARNAVGSLGGSWNVFPRSMDSGITRNEHPRENGKESPHPLESKNTEYGKRGYAPFVGRDMHMNCRPFDSLANGLIGKRSCFTNDPKRFFNYIPYGSRAYNSIANGNGQFGYARLLFRKRPFDPLANGLIG